MVRHVGRLLDGRGGSSPFELFNDGDLLLLIDRMLLRRGPDTVRITEVKGHADEGMVLDDRDRERDRLGNNAAGEAADFGRRRVGQDVIDARRNFSGVCGRWYPVILELRGFFIAISRAVVMHDGGEGTAPDPLVWSAGAPPKRRRLVHAVGELAMLPGPPAIWTSGWFSVPASALVLRMLLTGPTLLASWSSGLPSWALCTGLLVVLILGLVVFLMLRC